MLSPTAADHQNLHVICAAPAAGLVIKQCIGVDLLNII